MHQVLYLTRAKLSLSRAHTLNIVKTAEYVTALGDCTVTLFSAAKESKSKEAIFHDKAVRNDFPLDICVRRRSVFRALLSLHRKYDVIYLRDPFLWHVGCFARFILRKKVVFEVHGSHEWWWAKPFWRFSIAAAHGLLFITKNLQEYYNSAKPQIVVHTGGLDAADFEDRPDIRELRSELSLPQNATIILYAGSFLWPSKDMLVSLIEKLPQSAILVVLGVKKEEKQVLEKMARERNILHRLMVIGRLTPSAVPPYLLAADILINPLLIQYPGSVSSKLFEYLAAGKPIVSSGGAAVREILIDGQNALLVDSPTAEHFAHAIKRIIENNNVRILLSKNALKDSRAYTWQKRAEVVSEFLKGIL